MSLPHSAEKDAGLLEIRALAQRARGNSRFYAYTGPAANAFAALADDLDRLAEAMSTRPLSPGVHTPDGAA
jgi:hypothetical protein